MINIICAGMIVVGNAHYIDVSGGNWNVIYQNVHLIRDRDNIYSDGGQYEITIAKDHKKIWVQLDVDDNPTDRGEMLRCRKWKQQR